MNDIYQQQPGTESQDDAYRKMVAGILMRGGPGQPQETQYAGGRAIPDSGVSGLSPAIMNAAMMFANKPQSQQQIQQSVTPNLY